jgi:hypothetical protein
MKIILIKEKTCKVPTITGWILIVAFIGFVTCFVVLNLYSFLSKTEPIDTQVMVVEGWMPVFALEKAAKEFTQKKYSLVFSTGIPIDKGYFCWREKTFADMGATTMRHLGIDSQAVIAVPGLDSKVDRTFASACALKHWIDSTGKRICAINVISLGPHSRRSRLLFQKALGKKIKVGIVSYPDETYDPRRWWASSNGFKTIIDETVSYAYTKLFFWIKKYD